jgi:hypothetical protein
MLNSQRFAETRRLHLRCIMSNSTAAVPELKLLSVVIPARDEEGLYCLDGRTPAE